MIKLGYPQQKSKQKQNLNQFERDTKSERGERERKMRNEREE